MSYVFVAAATSRYFGDSAVAWQECLSLICKDTVLTFKETYGLVGGQCDAVRLLGRAGDNVADILWIEAFDHFHRKVEAMCNLFEVNHTVHHNSVALDWDICHRTA